MVLRGVLLFRDLFDGGFMKSVHPMLPVRDVVETAAFYRDKLGFEVKVLWGEPPFYAIVNRGNIFINFIQSQSISGKPGEIGGVYIHVEDVDVIYAEFAATDVEIWGEPEDREYGMRDFIILDLNGHRLCVGATIAR
jgi:catechol 2,3-dioxygenase-like lactoylglutathione lyase family enzyme